DEREALDAAPAEDLAAGEGAAVRPGELEGLVQEGEDRVPADEGAVMLGELCDQAVVERALTGGRDRRVATPVAGSVSWDARHGPGYAPTEDRGIVRRSSTSGEIGVECVALRNRPPMRPRGAASWCRRIRGRGQAPAPRGSRRRKERRPAAAILFG